MKTVNIDFTDSTIGTLGRAGEHNNSEVVFNLTQDLADCDMIFAEIGTESGEKILVEGKHDSDSKTFTILLTDQLTVEGRLTLQLVGYVMQEGSDEPQIIAKSPLVSGAISKSINGIETEAESRPSLLHRIWAKIADKLHIHRNFNTLDAFSCDMLDNPITDGDFNFGVNTADWRRLKFQGGTILFNSDGAVVSKGEEVEIDKKKYFRLYFNQPGLVTTESVPSFVDIPVNDVEDKFDLGFNGVGLVLPTGSEGNFVTYEEWDENISTTDERISNNTVLAEAALKACVESSEPTLTLVPDKHYNFGEVENLTLDFFVDELLAVYRNEYSFTFISGATPTVLTLPDTVKWVNELTVEANKRYEISIVDNIGLWCAVEVSG